MPTLMRAPIQILQQPAIEGLTARAYVAALAMQGLLSDSDERRDGDESLEDFVKNVARSSVMYADALIAALAPVTEEPK